MEQKLIRRNLSGIYIFDKFPNEDKRQPTCIEDCQQETRHAWALTKSQEYLRNAIEEIAKEFKSLLDYCKQENAVTQEQYDCLAVMVNEWEKKCKWNWSIEELAQQLDVVCNKLVMLADAVGVTRNEDSND